MSLRSESSFPEQETHSGKRDLHLGYDIFKTARNLACPDILSSYASFTCSRWKVSMRGWTPVNTLKFNVSSESLPVPLCQPSTERPKSRSCSGDTSRGSPDAAAMSSLPCSTISKFVVGWDSSAEERPAPSWTSYPLLRCYQSSRSTQGTVNEIVQQKRSPTLDHARKIAKVLNMEIGEIWPNE